MTNLTSAQLATIKAWVVANRNSVFDQGAADALNQIANPAYQVFRSDVTRSNVYKTVVAAGASSTGSATEWNWTGYKAQSVVEQNTWSEMMMGGCDFTSLPNRKGVLEIFGTAGNGGANRVHIFNVGRRPCTVAEKLFVRDVVIPPVNTGNVDADARGSLTNPDMLGINVVGELLEGAISLDTVIDSETA